MKDAYSKKEEQVVKFLETDAKKGLSEKGARNRLTKYGRNSLVHLKKVSGFEIFIRQFKNPLVYILLAAIVVSFFIQRFVDGWVIFAIVVLVMVILILRLVRGYSRPRRRDELRLPVRVSRRLL